MIYVFGTWEKVWENGRNNGKVKRILRGENSGNPEFNYNITYTFSTYLFSSIVYFVEMTAEERLAKQRSQGAIPKRRPIKHEDSESANEQSKTFSKV